MEATKCRHTKKKGVTKRMFVDLEMNKDTVKSLLFMGYQLSWFSWVYEIKNPTNNET